MTRWEAAISGTEHHQRAGHPRDLLGCAFLFCYRGLPQAKLPISTENPQSYVLDEQRQNASGNHSGTQWLMRWTMNIPRYAGHLTPSIIMKAYKFPV